MKKIERGVYSATIKGEAAIVAFTRRNRTTEEYLNQTTVFSTKQISSAKRLAKESSAALWIATEVQLKGKFAFSYAMPGEAWPKYKQRVAEFPVNAKARALYAADDSMLKDFHVVELEGVVVPMKIKAVTSKPVREELAQAAGPAEPKPTTAVRIWPRKSRT